MKTKDDASRKYQATMRRLMRDDERASRTMKGKKLARERDRISAEVFKANREYSEVQGQ